MIDIDIEIDIDIDNDNDISCLYPRRIARVIDIDRFCLYPRRTDLYSREVDINIDRFCLYPRSIDLFCLYSMAIHHWIPDTCLLASSHKKGMT